MLIDEFEALTGIYPDQELYALIEEEYMQSEFQKDEWCERYRNNVDGLAEKVQLAAEHARAKREKAIEEERESLRKEISDLHRDIASVLEKVRRLEAWRPFEVSLMETHKYIELWDSRTSEFDSAEDVKRWIACEFGFNPGTIRIVEKIPVYEKSREGNIRKTGEFEERKPAYYSTDWNYIRFDVETGSSTYQWEVVDGELYKFED